MGDMMEALLLHPFPRGDDLHIFTDSETGYIRATVPHHAIHHVPDQIGSPSGTVPDEQYRAGPGSEGSSGLYELALSVMAYYLPSGFEDEEPVILRTRRPRSDPMPVSRSAWDLHKAYADEVLSKIDPEHTTIQAGEIYAWVSNKKPSTAPLVSGPPGDDPFSF